MTDKIRLVCPDCATVNQFGSDRSGLDAKCGKCKARLLTGKPVEVDGSLLARTIRQSTFPVLVDFWAPWCAPCRVFAPTFESFAARSLQSDRLVVCLKLNTESSPAVGQQFNIRSIPTLALFQDGSESERISGALDPAGLARWVSRHLGS